MSRSILLAAVALAAYGVISTIVAAAVAALWRARLLDRRQWAPSATAFRLAALRLLPSVIGALGTAVVVLPVFAAFEPVHASEAVGPVLIGLALYGAVLVGSAVLVGLRTALITGQVERAWLRSATVLDVDPPAGVPAYVIDSISPIVALVGVFSPRLVAARAVIEACTPDELAAIVAHERGHLHSHDNLKRWLLTCAPDVLRWTAVHGRILAAWRDAAEDAADDAATHDREQARLDLAALLVKVARLAPAGPTPAAVSPFADLDGLERRVRRLVAAETPQGHGSLTTMLVTVMGGGTVLAITAIGNPSLLKPIYDVLEFTVAFGR